jgi:nitrite reductase (NADH) large subunit
VREIVVVVGNGMVGHRFCEELRRRDAADCFEVVVFGEESRAAYDRVHLSDFFAGRKASELALADAAWYRERGIALRLGESVLQVDPERRELYTSRGRIQAFDRLVLATGSAPFVPPLPGVELEGVFVYRTLDDLEAIAAWGEQARSAAVIGGGLLGLEAAKAVRDMGLATSVVEAAPRLMPRQVDARGGAVLREAIARLGVDVRVDVRTECLLGVAGQVRGLRFKEGPDLQVEMVVISAGIRPRDELARAAGLRVGARGGIAVDDRLETSAAGVYAIGECALHRGGIYGLVAPGYEMAEVLAARLTGEPRCFEGADLSTALKLLGVDVASFGDAFADTGGETRNVIFEDTRRGIYQKLLLDECGERLLGGILVGDAARYSALLQQCRAAEPLSQALRERPEALLFGAAAVDAAAEGGDEAWVCSCNGVTRGAIRNAIAAHALTTVGGVKSCTRAGTGCGGCVPQVERILVQALEQAGRAVDRNLCEHFAYTRQELFQIVKLGRVHSFEALLAGHGSGHGCEVCRPAVASILTSTWNDPILDHTNIQDTNDRFLANVQRGGTYSVIPRVPGGEITPEKLIVLGEVAKKYDLYCKITGGQRIDLLGARVEQLPEIWAELVAAGFESGHAYGKAVRTVKSCIGSTWCRFGVQDSTAFAIRIEERYRGIRAPHKLKSAVSGCIRECAEAQSKDFGVIATEQGWNLYLCGNGGSHPRHADLVASDVDEERVIQLLDRFLMYYIQTANPLERTARWLERLDGGIAYLKRVIVDDALGIGEQLERDMQSLVDSYACEWAAVVRDPERRRAFRHFANSGEPDPNLRFGQERGQKRPIAWPEAIPSESDSQPQEPRPAGPTGPEGKGAWRNVGRVDDFRPDSSSTVRVDGLQLAVFRLASREPGEGDALAAIGATGAWYATQAMCPHRRDMVLGRGLVGSQAGEPKVACPLHKKTFSLATGRGLSDPAYRVRTFEVEVRGNEVFVRVPDDASLADVGASPPCSAARVAVG